MASICSSRKRPAFDQGFDPAQSPKRARQVSSTSSHDSSIKSSSSSSGSGEYQYDNDKSTSVEVQPTALASKSPALNKEETVAKHPTEPTQLHNSDCPEENQVQTEKHANDVARYNLHRYSHLILNQPLKYVRDTDTANHGAETGIDATTRTCVPSLWPVAPEDNIQKRLFFNQNHKGWSWKGKWADATLKREIEKYERVKQFWLFEDHALGVPFKKGDDKYQFAASFFKDEMRSGWVSAWLRELIGTDEVQKIVAQQG